MANGGPKLQPFDGTCTPGTEGPNRCRSEGGTAGPVVTRYWRAFSIDDLIAAVLDRQFVGRRVVNKTGLAGLFDIRLSFTPDEESADSGAGASIFTALREQLGLRLIPARGTEEFLAVDHIERPSGN